MRSPGTVRRRWWWLTTCSGVVATTLLVVLLGTRGGRADVRPCRSALIPAYVSADEVTALARHAHPGRVLVINPDSGPGATADRAYRRAVGVAKRAGTRVLGYVPTGYGARDASAAEDEIDRYRSWYGVDGIFLDEVASDDASLAYYAALSLHVRSSGGRLVVLNPGLVPARGYFRIADVVVTFEGPVASYSAAVARAPSWLQGIPAGRIAHLIYGASREQALGAIGLAAHAGYLYATTGSPPHPWSVPAYADETEALIARC
jgi:spherulation-specific family 4 protein